MIQGSIGFKMVHTSTGDWLLWDFCTSGNVCHSMMFISSRSEETVRCSSSYVNNTFLHGDVHKEVYMHIAQGFAWKKDTRVCRLRKSYYGLQQALRNWYHKFTEALINVEFKQSKADHSLFIYNKGEIFIAALIYVDDAI